MSHATTPGAETWPSQASARARLPAHPLERQALLTRIERADLLSIIVLLTLTALTGWSHFRDQHRLYDLDTLTFYIPWYSFLGDRLSAFDIPGWLPYQFSGAPFAADPQSGWMYAPAMIVFAALSGTAAQAVFLVAHWLLGGLSTYVLARLLGMRWAGALVAAVAFEFGTFIEHTHRSLLRSQLSAWLPLSLIGIELSFRAQSWTGRLLAWSLTGFALSQVLAAWVGQGAYIALLVAGSYVAYRALFPPVSRPSIRDRMVYLFAGGGTILATTFGLNAAALLPRLEWNKRTNLVGGDYAGVYDDTDRGWSFARIVGRTISYENGQLYWYIGAATIVLALLALVVAARRYCVPYFAVLSAFAIVLTLDDGPVHRLFYLLPEFETLHAHQPNRTLVVLSMSVPLLAGATIDRLPSWSRSRFAFAAMLVPISFYGIARLTLPEDLRTIGSSTRNAVILTAAVLGVAAILGRAQVRGRLPASTVVPLLCVALIFWDPTGTTIVRALRDDGSDSAAQTLVDDYAGGTDPGGPGEFLQNALASGELFRYFGFDETHWVEEGGRSAWSYTSRYDEEGVVDILPPARAIRLELYDIQGYNPVHILRYDEYFEALNGRGQNYHVSEVLQAGVSSPLIDLLNVRYIVVPSGQTGGWDGAELVERGVADRVVYTDEQVHILENDGALPRAWVVHEARQVEPGEALAPLASGDIDPRQVALIETDPPNLAQPQPDARETVTILPAESPDQVRLTATLDADGLVVLSEVYDPGWRAYVDGERVPLLLTDHVLRSIPVPAGTHTIELRFEPFALKAGVAITSLTAIAILVVMAVAIRGRLLGRRPAPSSPRAFTSHDVFTVEPTDPVPRNGQRHGADPDRG